MNTATKNLENDHVYILRLTDVMEAIVNKGCIDPGHLDEIVSLIRDFADGFHHAKEEHLLFPAMGKKGFSPEQGPVAVMLHDHEEGRKYVRGMAEAIPSVRSGDMNAVAHLNANLMGYVTLLRNHIAKENNILFRMADQVLNVHEQQALLEQFAEVEESLSPGLDIDRVIKRIEDLAGIYLQTSSLPG